MLATESVVSPEDVAVKTEAPKPSCDYEFEGMAFLQLSQNEIAMPVERRGRQLGYLLGIFGTYGMMPHALDKVDGGLIMFAPSFDCFTKREYAAIDRHHDSVGWLGSIVYFKFSKLTLQNALEKYPLERVLGLPICRSEEFKANFDYLLNPPDGWRDDYACGASLPEYRQHNGVINLLFCDFDLFQATKTTIKDGKRDAKKREFILANFDFQAYNHVRINKDMVKTLSEML